MMLSETSGISSSPTISPTADASKSAEGRGQTRAGLDDSTARKLGSLVLTRHLGESIMIGDDVEVQVVDLRPGTVRIKVMAPRTIAVHRREVFDMIQASPVGAEPLPPLALALETTAVARPSKPQGGLVLSRYTQQSIMVGNEIEVMIVEIRPATVKLKITAPRSVAVHRREVYDALQVRPV
jgi:carbon storage regulator